MSEKFESIIFKRVVDARSPLHFATATHEIDVIFPEAVNTVATRFLGRSAGTIGGAQQSCDVFVVCCYRHDADTDPKPEFPILPVELVVPDRRAQGFSRLHGLFQAATLKQNAELIATKARQGVTPANFRFEQRP